MKKLYFIIPIVLITIFYLAYVLPFGLEQNQFEDHFEIVKSKIFSYSKEYTKISKIEDFISKSNEVIASKKEVEYLEKEFSNLNEKRTFSETLFGKNKLLYRMTLIKLKHHWTSCQMICQIIIGYNRKAK